MENHNGEKLVSLNLERIKYWMAKKARLSNPVAELLGLCNSLFFIQYDSFDHYNVYTFVCLIMNGWMLVNYTFEYC
jgi:hypothetical protein